MIYPCVDNPTLGVSRGVGQSGRVIGVSGKSKLGPDQARAPAAYQCAPDFGGLTKGRSLRANMDTGHFALIGESFSDWVVTARAFDRPGNGSQKRVRGRQYSMRSTRSPPLAQSHPTQVEAHTTLLPERGRGLRRQLGEHRLPSP